MSKWNITNSYLDLPNVFFSKQAPSKASSPKKICFNYRLASELGLDFLSEIEILDYFSGNKVPNNAKPIAQAYAGHQFGHFTMLGDGRAVLLCEHTGPKNERHDIQIKGSGKTPYSRGGDGLATLSSVLREYIVSESMHSLGIPTTRSLAVIKTNDKVYREDVHSRGILTRTSSSHIRVGTFEFARRFCPKDNLKILVDYVIDQHYPQIKDSDNPAIELFELVANRQIKLIVNWMRVGFIHGVMNTDNMSVTGETIDYGPCSFMNTYNPNTVFSSIDRGGRYSFGNQPSVLQWNLTAFANTLLPLISNNEQKAVQIAKDKLQKISLRFYDSWYNMMYKKIGILNPEQDDRLLVDSLLEQMQTYKSDYTNTFAALTLNRSYDDGIFKSIKFKDWKVKWDKRISLSGNRDKSLKLMQSQNPSVIPRNHIVESAINQSKDGNFSEINSLLDLTSNPYNYKTKFEFQNVPEGFDESYRTFCGT